MRSWVQWGKRIYDILFSRVGVVNCCKQAFTPTTLPGLAVGGVLSEIAILPQLTGVPNTGPKSPTCVVADDECGCSCVRESDLFADDNFPSY